MLVIRGDRQAQPGAQPRIPLREYGGHLLVGALGDNTVHDLVGEVFGQVAPFGSACHVAEGFADLPEPEVFQLATVGRCAVQEGQLSATRFAQCIERIAGGSHHGLRVCNDSRCLRATQRAPCALRNRRKGACHQDQWMRISGMTHKAV